VPVRSDDTEIFGGPAQAVCLRAYPSDILRLPGHGHIAQPQSSGAGPSFLILIVRS